MVCLLDSLAFCSSHSVFRMREDKLHQQKQLQEERIKKALERSQSENKKIVSGGRTPDGE